MKARVAACAVLTLGGIWLASPSARAISRADIVARAPAYEEHAWNCGADNLTAECADSSWVPAVSTVGPQVGLPYCWGGFVTVDEFDQQIAAGYGAGSLPDGLFLDCTTGVDCSGYVSQLWAHWEKLGTSTIPDWSVEVDVNAMLPGDVFNDSGHHVIMWLGKEANGDALVTEATNASACMGVCRRARPYSAFAGYIPRAYMLADLPEASGAGTKDDPIRILAFPYKDWRDTSKATSDELDYYSTAPDTDERGPEYIYVFHAASGGAFTASIKDGAGVDIDVHLLSALDTSACIARDDRDIAFTIPGPGTYYIVADTYVGSSLTEYSGAYYLTATFDGALEPPAGEDAGPEAGPEPPAEAGPGWDAGSDALVEASADAEGSDSGGTYAGGAAVNGDDGGCGCRAAGSRARSYAAWTLLLGALLGLRWRRARRGLRTRG